MAYELTADDILPLVMRLPPYERSRLLQMTIDKCLADTEGANPPLPRFIDFSSGEELLSWDTESGEVVKFFNLHDRD